MTNAANLLLDFFTGDMKNRELYTFSRLYSAIIEIEENLVAWEKMGQETSAFHGALPTWKNALSTVFTENLQSVTPSPTGLSASDTSLLMWLSEKLDAVSPTFDEAARKSVEKFLAAVKNAVLSDTSIPEPLRLHISRLVLHIEDALAQFAVTGDFVLADALDRLIGSVRVAESASKEPSTWEKVWSEYGKPITIALIASTPPAALQFAQMLALNQ